MALKKRFAFKGKRYKDLDLEERRAYNRGRYHSSLLRNRETARDSYHRRGDQARVAPRRRSRLKAGIKNATGERRVGDCVICGEPGVVLACDHNHQTGEIRGWPCKRCNSGIGMLKDDPVIVEKALKYLRGELNAGS